MDQKLITTYKYLEKNHPSVTQDIYYSLELLTGSLNCGIEELQKEINATNNSGNFSKLSEIAEYAQTIKNLKSTMDEYLTDISAFCTTTEIDMNSTSKDNEKDIPNYQDYAVNTEVPHTLSENFTNKKICGFFLNGIKYHVDTWQEALIKLSDILIEKDAGIFYSFINHPTFKGSKNCYFSLQSNDNKYYRKLSNANIYVWVNLNVTTICEIMKNMLRSYSIPVNNMYIYIRADYTTLHATKDVSKSDDEDLTDKVGKYVRNTMRMLSESGYTFSDDMLCKLTSSDSTKNIFGIGIPFFKEVKDETNLSFQVKDSLGRNRYWKETFEFNGKKFLIVSQWYETNRTRFNRWISKLYDPHE